MRWVVSRDCKEIQNIEKFGIKCLKVAVDAQGKLDLREMLDLLFKDGVKSLLVEGGAKTYQSFIDEDLVQRIYLFQAPILYSGSNRIPWFTGFGQDFAKRIEEVKFTNLDPDWLMEFDLT